MGGSEAWTVAGSAWEKRSWLSSSVSCLQGALNSVCVCVMPPVSLHCKHDGARLPQWHKSTLQAPLSEMYGPHDRQELKIAWLRQTFQFPGPGI